MKNTRRQLPDRSDIALTPMVVPAASEPGVADNTAPVDHKIEWIDITQIKTDGGTQMRNGLNPDRVDEYAEEMAEVRSWGKFPHVVVFYDGTNYWLADGFHRVAAAARMPLIIPTVLAEVNAGTRRDAILYAAGANASHGLPRTAADKRRAIETLLRDEEWAKWSDREIGRRCAVSRTTVGTVRTELSLSKFDSENAGERTYITRHGTEATMRTGNIGRVVYVEPSAEPPAVMPTASVEAIQEAICAWVATVTKDVDNQTYYLRSIQEGQQESSLYQLIGHMQRVSQIHAYRDEDLTEAIRIELEERALRRAEKEAKRGPQPPDEWRLKNAIETWLAGKGLKSVPQRNLIVELREKEDKHPDYAEMTATLPEHWRRRELNRALSSLADSLGWKVGHDEWEAVQLPSGRWYARDKSRSPQTTVSFDTEAEALAAIEQADDEHSRFYKELETVISNPSEPWGFRNFFDDAPADVIAEAKIGLEKLAALGDAPSYVAERLKRIEKRVEAAQRLLQMTVPERSPVIAVGHGEPSAEELEADGFGEAIAAANRETQEAIVEFRQLRDEMIAQGYGETVAPTVDLDDTPTADELAAMAEVAAEQAEEDAERAVRDAQRGPGEAYGGAAIEGARLHFDATRQVAPDSTATGLPEGYLITKTYTGYNWRSGQRVCGSWDTEADAITAAWVDKSGELVAPGGLPDGYEKMTYAERCTAKYPIRLVIVPPLPDEMVAAGYVLEPHGVPIGDQWGWSAPDRPGWDQMVFDVDKVIAEAKAHFAQRGPGEAVPQVDEWANGAVSLDRDWSVEELAAYEAANAVIVPTVTITLNRDIAQKLHAALLVGAMRFELDTMALTQIKRSVGEALGA